MRNFILYTRQGFLLSFFYSIAVLFSLSSMLIFCVPAVGSDLHTEEPLLPLAGKLIKKDRNCDNGNNMTKSKVGNANYCAYQNKSWFAINDQVFKGENQESRRNRFLTATAAKGRISGYVVNTEDGAIESVKLKLRGKKTKDENVIYSNTDGFFEFVNLEKDTYVIVAMKNGYVKNKQKVELKKGEEKNIIFELGNLEEASATIGPSGGIVEVVDLLSPLYGAKVEIPEGALEMETNITISVFPESEFEEKIGGFPAGIRFFGGIKVQAGGAILKKAISISIPNSFGATGNDQLVVTQVIAYDSKAPLEAVYKGVAQASSLLTFGVSNFGSFGVLSPAVPLGLIGGTLLNQTDNSVSSRAFEGFSPKQSISPVSNGVIATSFSKPFVALTNNEGYFEIPAGPAGSFVTVMGIPPSDLILEPLSPTGGMGMESVQLPKVLQTPPTSIVEATTELIIGIISETLGVDEDPPPTCNCDVPPSSPVFSSNVDTEPPFELYTGQTAQTYMIGLSGVYGGSAPPLATLPMDAIQIFWDGSLCIPSQVSFSIDDSSIAEVDQTGELTAKSKGETWLRGEVKIACNKKCDDGSYRYCDNTLQAVSAKVVIGDCFIYVDAAKGDEWTGNGSKEKPFKTISAGVWNAVDGCTIVVAEGVYNESVSIYYLDINLQGAGAGKSVIKSPYNNGNGIGVTGSNVTISGFSITGDGILLTDSEATITLNEIYDSNYGGISANNSKVTIVSNKIYGHNTGIGGSNSTATINSNEIFDNNYAGISTESNSSATVTSNKIYNNNKEYSGWGIIVSQSSAIINSNEIYNNSGSGVGIWSSATATVTSNKIYSNSNGIYLNDSSSGTIISNEIYNNHHDGVIILNSTAEISSNQIHNNDYTGISIDPSSSQSSTATIKENVIINHDIDIWNWSNQNIYAPGNTFDHVTEYEIDRWDIYDYGYWDTEQEKFIIRCETCGEVIF